MSEQQLVQIDYVNWRGERGKRMIHPCSIRFAATEWHPEPQWLLSAWDVAKKAPRDFAMKDIHAWTPVGANLRVEPPGPKRRPDERHYDAQGYCDNPARGY
jgi:predicted DNA-binding transcriptional regulator YafY